MSGFMSLAVREGAPATQVLGDWSRVSGFAGYSGQAYSPAGDKGRFVLPPAFRKAVKESSGGAKTLCLAKHERWNCLVGFGLSRRAELEQQLDREEENAFRAGRTDFDRDLRSLQLFGFTEVPFDDSGRFIMPEHLRTLGKVGDGLYFQGGGRFFTIWSPEELARMGAGWESAQAACLHLVAEAAAKGKGKEGGE
ncbi:MAG: division/cell wall cluster transcriptional repressor MraZ [Erythrobacter sp.]